MLKSKGSKTSVSVVREDHGFSHEVFVIFDSKTMSYDLPAFAINHHDIIRQLLNLFQDPQQRSNRYVLNAEDYSIFRSGYFDKKTGQLTTCTLSHIANLHDLRAAAQPPAGHLAGQGIVPT